MKNKLRLALLGAFVLIFLAILQVLLIFGRSLGKNNTQKEPAYRAEMIHDLIMPANMYITPGGKTDPYFFRVELSDREYEELFSEAEMIFAAAKKMDPEDRSVLMKKGTEVLMTSHAALVFYYEAGLGQEVLTQILGADFRAEDENAFKEAMIREIWIFPASDEEEKVTLAFYDTASKNVWLLETEGRRMAGNTDMEATLARAMEKGTMDTSNRFMELSLLYPDVFPEGGFMKEVSLIGEYSVCELLPYFETDQGMEEAMLAYAERFFDSSAVPVVRENEKNTVYSNDRLSLKAAPDGYVLYVETLTEEQKTASAITEEYAICEVFLEKALAGCHLEVCPAGYKKDGERTIFYFDFVIDGVEVTVDDELLEKWNLQHAVEVTVRGSGVERAQWLLVKCTRTNTTMRFSENWIDVADTLLSLCETIYQPPRLTYYYKNGLTRLLWKTQTEKGIYYYRDPDITLITQEEGS